MIVPIITQGDDYSCGPTCAMMVLSYYLGRLLEPEERESLRSRCLSGGSTSQNSLIKTLRGLGLRVGIRRGDTLKALRKAFYYQRPVIVYHEKSEHWMVAVAEHNGTIICNDPQSPVQVHYSLGELSSVCLVISSSS